MSGPFLPSATARANAGRDGMAWALAALPLVSALSLAVLAIAGIVDDMRALSVLTLLASAALVAVDKQRLRRLGLAGTGLPSAWWFLVPPAYLWRRAAALGGSRASAWAWLGTSAGAFVICIAVLAAVAAQVAGKRAAAERLPDCADRGMAADIRAVFDSLPAARQDGVKAVSLSGQREVGQGGQSRPARGCTMRWGRSWPCSRTRAG